jgi:predicted RNA-binding Zn-ribbon protein involved in translation (DUF1610 family)
MANKYTNACRGRLVEIGAQRLKTLYSSAFLGDTYMVTSSLGNTVTNMAGSVSFPCPKCQETTLTRTRNEREIAAKYLCRSCGFVGPN